MDREEIIDKLIEALKFHLTCTAHMQQEPYKGTFFKLFKEAYKNGLCADDNREQLTGDVLTDLANTRLSEFVDEAGYDKTIERFTIMWNEWRYALDNC